MSSQSRIQLENYLNTLTVRGKVLDLGGSQFPIKGRTKTWGATRYDIMDLENPHQVKESPDIEGDIQENIDKLALKQEYDIVFCIEVSEYWHDPISALRNIYSVLVKGGVLYISFHFIYPVHNPEKLDYLRYTRNGVIKMLEEAGFGIEEIKPRYLSMPVYATILYDHEQMRGVGKNRGEIHKEQGYMVKCIKI